MKISHPAKCYLYVLNLFEHNAIRETFWIPRFFCPQCSFTLTYLIRESGSIFMQVLLFHPLPRKLTLIVSIPIIFTKGGSLAQHLHSRAFVIACNVEASRWNSSVFEADACAHMRRRDKLDTQTHTALTACL